MPKTSKTNNKYRRRSMLGVLIVVALLLLAIIGSAVLQFFSRGPESNMDPEILLVNFYFRDTEEHWGQELREIELTDNIGIIEAVLVGLQEGPRTAAFLPSIPEDVQILRGDLMVGVEENTLRVTFSQSFSQIAPLQRIFVIGSLVYTLTGLDFVNNLTFYIGDEPMLDGDGGLFGLRNRDNTTLEGSPTIGQMRTEVVVLYFPDEQMMWLVAEERTITTSPFQDTERYIVDALIVGPETPGLFPSLPADAVYNRVERSGDLLTIDFTADFLTSLAGGSSAEAMMVFSLVNTLTERPETRRVQILIDGLPIQPDEHGDFHIDLSRPIERDESLIYNHEEGEE